PSARSSRRSSKRGRQPRRRARSGCGSTSRGRITRCTLAAMMNVAVLGAGAWGTALAKVLADKQNPTVLWSHRAELAGQINESHVNARYLPSAVLPPTLRATHDLEDALRGADLVVV